ncbi:hypothetical protein DTO021C3_8485 [Paecilomyces variotii]|nr:hypothetical protein DTO021C3_8485 [Paecilomyces variotii]KAJ9356454.1 hypothetical protein DTO027B9_3666 [Paecilomyces variotii]KAJ9369215.1 hypothetical protein DTO282E5_6150 [Paecilomyces variotii]
MIEGYLPRVRAQTETAGRRHHTETPQPEGRPPIISCSVLADDDLAATGRHLGCPVADCFSRQGPNGGLRSLCQVCGLFP